MAGFSLGRSADSTLPTSDSHSSPIPSYTRGSFELWQHHHLFPTSHSNLLSFSHDPAPLPPVHHHTTSRSMRGPSGGGINCQDCGNQAKKDCSHLRCRTCCKSRGFQCSTHVKSTWVPAAKRRERQQQLAASQQHHRSSGSESSKRPRELMLHSGTSRLLTALASATTSTQGMEAASVAFPAEVSSPAVFRCVRVSPMDEAEDEYAYQAAVTIGGHLFKGILYDHGPEGSGMLSPCSPTRQHAESTSSAAATAITTSTAAAVTTAAVATQASLLDPSSLYPAPLSAFMAGTQFFPQNPRP